MPKSPKVANQDRPHIIETVQTPLGFFTLVILVVEVMFGIVASTASASQRTFLVVAMLALVFVLIGVVTVLAYVRPEALLGTRAEAERSARHGWRPALVHHVSVPVTDLPRSVAFYRSELGLPQIEPDPLTFGLKVAWFELPSGQQLHLLKSDTPQVPGIENRERVWEDAHFALRVGDVRKARERLVKKHRLYINEHVGFDRYPHFYVLDPDGHVIEVTEIQR